MNAVGNQSMGMAYKPDDDLYNTKYEIEHAADQGYPPYFSIGPGRPKVAYRIGDVKMPRLVVQQKYAISIPFRRVRFVGHPVRAVLPVLAWMLLDEFRLAVNYMLPSDRQDT